MYSLVIKIAIDVIRAVLLVKIKPMLELSIDNVEVVIADPHPNSISVINSQTYFLFKDSYIFL